MTLLARPILPIAAFALLLPTTTAVADKAANIGTLANSTTGDSDEPRSIYDEELRRFRFRVDHAVVTVRYVATFVERYRAKGHPEILGAYPDDELNVIVVVGVPEAERSIRRVLAEEPILLAGVGNPSLDVRRRVLEEERRDLITDITSLEIGSIDLDEADPEHRGQRAKLDGMRAELENELAIVERKLAVVARNLERLRNEP